MSNAEQTANPRRVEMRVAAVLENLAVLRTVIGALATFEDLDLDAVSDLKLAADEACTRLIRSASAGATLVLWARACSACMSMRVSHSRFHSCPR